MAIKRVIDDGVVNLKDLPESERTNNKKKKKKKERKSLKQIFRRDDDVKKGFNFRNNELLKNIKPKEGYFFHSDYFEIDDCVASILSFFHVDGAYDPYGVFWGVNKIPHDERENFEAVVFESIERMGSGWIDAHQTKAEGIAAMDTQEVTRAGTSKSKMTASKKVLDLEEVSRELQSGASYLNVKYRILVKAKDIDTLDRVLSSIEKQYIDRFATLSIAAYAGEQRSELSNLFRKNEKKLGRGYYFTSTEYAGSYSLVTHGIEDAAGEYVGHMAGDVNNSAVLFDVDNFEHHVVVSNESIHCQSPRIHCSDRWASKISQSALLNNHKVVHIVMNDCNLDLVGPKFESITYKIDVKNGAVNMFEMFGDEEDELTIFSAQMEKLILMAEQAYQTTDADRSIIRGSLEEIATDFYVGRGMWYHNAKENRDKLRIVNIPHNQVPRLSEFVSYVDTARKEQLTTSAKDPEKIHAFNVLSATFHNMLSTNNDLFNTLTDPVIDVAASRGQRVVYDFNGLMHRGQGVAMAQLVNVIGFAVGQLKRGDVLIIHGADLIDNNVKDYLEKQLNRLYSKGGRVAFIYDDHEKMLADKHLCRFDKADYMLFGFMTDTTVSAYQQELGQNIPVDLVKLITVKNDKSVYIRRGFD